MPNLRALATFVPEIFIIEISENGKTCYFVLFLKILFLEIVVWKFTCGKLKVNGKRLLRQIFTFLFIILFIYIYILKWPTTKNSYSSIFLIFLYFSLEVVCFHIVIKLKWFRTGFIGLFLLLYRVDLSNNPLMDEHKVYSVL